MPTTNKKKSPTRRVPRGAKTAESEDTSSVSSSSSFSFSSSSQPAAEKPRAPPLSSLLLVAQEQQEVKELGPQPALAVSPVLPPSPLCRRMIRRDSASSSLPTEMRLNEPKQRPEQLQASPARTPRGDSPRRRMIRRSSSASSLPMESEGQRQRGQPPPLASAAVTPPALLPRRRMIRRGSASSLPEGEGQRQHQGQEPLGPAGATPRAPPPPPRRCTIRRGSASSLPPTECQHAPQGGQRQQPAPPRGRTARMMPRRGSNSSVQSMEELSPSSGTKEQTTTAAPQQQYDCGHNHHISKILSGTSTAKRVNRFKSCFKGPQQQESSSSAMSITFQPQQKRVCIDESRNKHHLPEALLFSCLTTKECQAIWYSRADIRQMKQETANFAQRAARYHVFLAKQQQQQQHRHHHHHHHHHHLQGGGFFSSGTKQQQQQQQKSGGDPLTVAYQTCHQGLCLTRTHMDDLQRFLDGEHCTGLEEVLVEHTSPIIAHDKAWRREKMMELAFHHSNNENNNNNNNTTMALWLEQLSQTDRLFALGIGQMHQQVQMCQGWQRKQPNYHHNTSGGPFF